MSDLSDKNDRASVREEQLRNDALDDVRRKQSALITQTAAQGVAETCDACGDKIPLARQRAVPYARLCVDCARDAETRDQARKRA